VKWRRGQGGERDAGPHAGNIVAIKPMKDGVIADFKVTEKMRVFHPEGAQRKMLVHPRIVIGVPSEITQVEKRAGDGLGVSRQSERSALVEQPWWRRLERDCRLPSRAATWW